MDRRACAAVHGRTVCAARLRREAQGTLPRTMRGKAPRSALDLFGYFLGQLPKSNRLAAGETKLCASTNEKIKNGFRLSPE